MLQVLPQNISNLIAAGEVVSRPASVVKELVENAVDAGASSITVVVSDSGRTLIQVIDNGCGMTPEEAVLCFQRHATSKIASAEDLERIMTYGFRGEALASIAAVAEVTLRTRRPDAEIATEVTVSGTSEPRSGSVAAPAGTSISVRSLFYNVPARRKFLKSDSAELRNIVQEFLRIALIRTGLALKLVSNGKELYNLRPARNTKQRINDVFGMNLAKGLVEVKVDTTLVRVSGYIGNPLDAHKRQGNQYLFVNGRFFKSPFLHKAVCKPYEKLIPEDTLPAYFIFLETDPEKVDVNIHPAKTEVKFEDEPLIFEILSACVREALGKNDFTPSIDFDVKGAPEIPLMPDFKPGGFNPGRFRTPSIDYDPLFNPFNLGNQLQNGPEPAFEPSFEPTLPQPQSYGRLFEEDGASRNSKLLVLQQKYIVTPVRSGLMVVDILRARERIYYERYLEKLAEQLPVSVQTLFPLTFTLSAEDHMTLLEQPDLLESLGFDIRDFGGTSVVVHGLPEGYSAGEESVRRCLDELISALRDDTSLDDHSSHMAAKMAESAAKSGHGAMNPEEAQLLVDQLFACREPGLTPGGRRCTAMITLEELEKKL